MTLLIQNTLIYTSVLMIVALGGMFSERSGVINLGLEGIMVIGALFGVMVCSSLGKKVPPFFNFAISTVVAMLAGLIFSLLLAVACVSFKADQTITGTALNIMSTGLAVVIARVYTKSTSSQIFYEKSVFDISSHVTYFALLMILIVVLAYIYLYKTSLGLHLMACGEHPHAADSVGINVYKNRYIGVLYSGILAGLGGFAYVVQSAGNWDFKNGVSGFGFLALAVMIFGQWKPFKILLAALIFGFCQAASIQYSGKGGIPTFIYKMLPYIVCMVVLALTSKHSKAPKAEGQIYDKGER